MKHVYVAACVATSGPDPLYLDLWCWRLQDFRQARRRREAQAGRFKLLEMSYDPSGLAHAFPTHLLATAPGPVVRADVWAVPRIVTRGAGLIGEVLRRVVVDLAHAVWPRGWPDERGLLRVGLVTPDPALECLSAKWTGLSPTSETRRSLSIEAQRKIVAQETR